MIRAGHYTITLPRMAWYRRIMPAINLLFRGSISIDYKDRP